MLKVALTGGIGSGKSVASTEFERLGIEVIDADVISRELVKPGQAALSEISKTFGQEILLDDGNLDRKKLRGHIFSDPRARQQLEDILHPLIHQRIQEQIKQAKSPYVLMVIPLLTEGKKDYAIDRVLLIDAPEILQKQRVMQRDNCSAEELTSILASQSSREDRRRIADDIILNDGNLSQLQQSVQEQHLAYLAISGK